MASLLIHRGYEPELRTQLNKLNISTLDKINPLDPATVPVLDNNLTVEDRNRHSKYANVRRLCSSFQNYRTTTYNAVANFFLKFGIIDLKDLKSFDLVLPTNSISTGPILDHNDYYYYT